jgi:invasion protein IalB
MMLKFIYAASAIGLAAGASVPALAQAQPAPSTSQKAADPKLNEVVCQTQKEIGSRLATKRICKTRAEWADSRLEDRRAVEKIQTERSMPGN